jgi:hypothetical protein
MANTDFPDDFDLTPVNGNPFGPEMAPKETYLSSYTPSWSERIGGMTQDLLSSLGMSRGNAQEYGQSARTAAGFTPVVGQLIAGNEARRAYEQGNYVGAGINLLGALPLPASAAEREAYNVWHGSPHTFSQFDLSKIGTGEGAQAYGQGFYLAEHQGVAKSYAENLSGSVQSDLADSYLKGFNGNIEEALKQFEKESNVLDLLPHEEDEVRYFIKNGVPQGNLYSVNVKAPKEHFLDYDKPFEEQSDHVQQLLKPLLPEGDWRDEVGSFLYDSVANKLSGKPPLSFPGAEEQAKASAALHEAGIPGIKYLDAGSRPRLSPAAQNYLDMNSGDVEKALQHFDNDKWNPGRMADEVRDQIKNYKNFEGTHNLVVFDPSSLEVTHRNGEKINFTPVEGNPFESEGK